MLYKFTFVSVGSCPTVNKININGKVTNITAN